MSIHVCTQLYTHVYTTVYTRVHYLALSISLVGLLCTALLGANVWHSRDTAKAPWGMK